MRYHDGVLESYTVSGAGDHIVLRLAWFENHQKIHSNSIEFAGVVLYDFRHLEGTIIDSIDELSFEGVESEILKLAERLGSLGGKLDRFGPGTLVEGLKNAKCKCWYISSAIGFEGLVVGKSISETAA